MRRVTPFEQEMRIAKPAALLLALASVACSTTDTLRTELEGLGGIAVSAGSSSGSAAESPEATLDFPSDVAYGGDVNFRFGYGKWSFLFGVQFATADVEVHGTSEPLQSGEIKALPLEWIFQWHPLGLAPIDPYVGVGTAIVFPTDTELELADGSGRTASLHFEPTLALAADLGARFGFGPHFGLLVDAKYFHGKFVGAIPIQDIPGGALPDASFDFLIASGGVSYRF
jgi:outer membrane protein W